MLSDFITICRCPKYRFRGTITDENGTPIMGANIVAVEKETQVLDGLEFRTNRGYYMLTLKRYRL